TAEQLATRVQTTIPQQVKDSAEHVSGDLAAKAGGLAQQLGNVFGMVAKEVLAALNQGMTQIQKDLGVLSYTVGAAYPLVAYFVLHKEFQTIREEYLFLEQVVWNDTDRKDEVRRVAYAAFGSLGLLAFPKASPEDGAGT